MDFYFSGIFQGLDNSYVNNIKDLATFLIHTNPTKYPDNVKGITKIGYSVTLNWFIVWLIHSAGSEKSCIQVSCSCLFFLLSPRDLLTISQWFWKCLWWWWWYLVFYGHFCAHCRLNGPGCTYTVKMPGSRNNNAIIAKRMYSFS